MKTLNLKKPIKLEKTEISKLTFKDHATAEDLISFDLRGMHAQTIALIASLTGTDEAIIKKLHVSDYYAADEIAMKMIKNELGTEGIKDPDEALAIAAKKDQES